MLTDRRIFQPFDTGREVAIHRTPHVNAPDPPCSRLTDEQAKRFAHMVRMLSHLSGTSFRHVASSRLGGAALRQVLDILGAE